MPKIKAGHIYSCVKLNFDFRAYFGHFSLVKKVKYKMPNKQQKMASNKKMQENKSTLKFNFT